MRGAVSIPFSLVFSRLVIPRFRSGKLWGIPPVFSEECVSGFAGMTSSECVFESVQALWIVRVTEELAFVFCSMLECWGGKTRLSTREYYQGGIGMLRGSSRRGAERTSRDLGSVSWLRVEGRGRRGEWVGLRLNPHPLKTEGAAPGEARSLADLSWVEPKARSHKAYVLPTWGAGCCAPT
jgi:hypothetical protein